MTMRVATLAEIGTVLDWAATEGWNPGLADAPAFHAADPEGFFVAEIDGAPAAAISVVNHDADHAFLGLYLCRPAFRGLGIGYALWHHALAHAGGRTVGLDGVAAQQANYAKSGFVREGATRRFTGVLAPLADRGIRPVGPEDLPALIALDAAAGGVMRPAFLRAWLEPGRTRRAVVLEDQGGFAVCRLCRDGLKIGPILAPDANTALRLAGAAVAAFPPAPVSIDLPERNAALQTALTARGFTPAFETARMYRGPAPRTDGRVQAIATMELG